MNSDRVMDSLAASYREQGYCFPVARLPRSMISAAARRVDALLASPPAGLEHPWNIKAHLLFDWVYELTVHPLVLDAVEAVIGPNILMQAADVFAKPGHSRKYVNWHQDGNYWNLDPFELCTAWIALTDVFPENGCMRFLPGTHCHQKLEHTETCAANSALTRGQQLVLDIDEKQAVQVILRAGEVSLHHCLLAHASGPNRTDGTRVGIAVRYVPTSLRQTAGPPMSAILVRGEDRYGHFALDSPPGGELRADDIESQARAMRPHAPSDYATA